MKKIKMKKVEIRTLEEGFKEFITDRTVKGLSPATIKAYKGLYNTLTKVIEPETELDLIKFTFVFLNLEIC